MSARTASPQLAEALDALPLPFALFDPDRRLVFCNRALLAVAGLDPQRVRTGMPLVDLLRLVAFQGGYGPGDPERLAEAHAAIDRTRPLRQLLRGIDGRVAESYSVPLAGGGFATIAAEVTGFVLAQSEAAREAHRLLGMLSRSRTGIALFDAANRLVLRNAAYGALIGAPPGLLHDGMAVSELVQELAARGEYAMQPPGWAAGVIERDRRSQQRMRRQRPSGEHIELVSTPEPGGGFLVEVTDITALVEAEAEAQRRAGLLQGILDTVPIGISLADSSGRLVAYNAVAERFAGLSPDRDHRGRHADDIIDEQIRNGEFAEDPATLARVGELRRVSRKEPLRYRRTRPDGTVLDVISRPMPGGGWVDCRTDVTPLIAAEAEARRRAAVQQVMLETMRHGIVLFGPDQRIVAANRLAGDLVGLPPELLRPGTGFVDYVAARHAAGGYGAGEAADAERRRVLARDHARPQEVVRTDARGRTTQTHSNPTEDGGFVITITDVTAQHQAEAEAQREAAIRAVMLETMRHGLVLYDAEMRVVAANALAAELPQTPPGMLRPGVTMEELVRAQHAAGAFGAGQTLEEILGRVLAIDRTKPHRYTRSTSDGRLIEFVSEPVPGGGFVLTITDVTELKRAEAEAQREAAIRAVMLETMRHGIALHDAEGRVVAANALISELAELPPGALRPGASMEELVRAQSAAGVFGAEPLETTLARLAAIDRRRPYRCTRERRDGRIVEYVSEPVDAGGFVVTVTDITARMRAEEAAQRQAALLGTMLGSIRHGVALHDAEGRLIAANPLAEKLCGLAPGTLRPGVAHREVGRLQAAGGEFGPPAEALAFLAEKGALDRRLSHRYRRRRPDGATIEIVSDPTPDGGFVVTASDVTELLATRADAEQRARILDVLLRSVRHGVEVYGADGRLLASNGYAAEFLGLGDPAGMLGATLAENLRRQAEAGEFGPPEAAEAWLARLDALDRRQPHRHVRRRPTGRLVEFHSDPTPDGGFVVTSTDVTELVEAQEGGSQQRRLVEAMLGTMRHSVALYDAQARLVVANGRAMDLAVPVAIEPGATIAEQLRQMADAGAFGSPEETAAWLSRLIALDRREPHRYLRTLPNGQTIEFVSEPLADGGFVVTGTDVTALLAAEREAAERLRETERVLATLRQGVMLIGPDGRLRIANALCARLMGLAPEELAPGTPAAELFRRQRARGEFGQGEAAAAFTERMRSLDRARPERYLRQRPDGTWLDIASDPVEGGGYVITVADVTPLFAAQEELARRAEMQRAMLDNTRHGITLYDADGRLLAANALAARLTGLPEEALAPGRTLEEIRGIQRARGEFGAPAEAERWQAGSMAGAMPQDGSYVRERPDGSVLEVITRTLPGGGFVRTYTDITQLTRAEEASRRQSAVQSAMLENIRHGIAMYDADSRLIACNAITAELTGLDPADLRPGVHQDELVAKQAAGGEFEGRSSAVDVVSGRQQSGIALGRYVRRRPNGRFLEVTTQSSPDGGFVRTYTDVSEDRAIREELTRARDAAEQASRAKSRFLATMTHELRTPLNAVIGFASLLRGGARPEDTAEYARQIEEAGRHLLGLIDDVLDVARSGSGLPETESLPLDPAALAESAVGLMRAEAEAAGVALGFSTARDVPRVLGDATRLRQVLLNLLGNAIKFTGEGGRVSLAVRRAGSGVEICVADTGIGIAEADIARAFEPFSQLDNTLGRRFPGSGLGLYLARTLCEAMGMRLSLASAAGEGTSVTIQVPPERFAAPETTPP
jgi:PAS domain-containing protein/anti-sigma regulatory factor (Ser/Thr protein kinase)